MPILTETRHAGGFLVWEALRDYCRSTVILASGNLQPGTILGKITACLPEDEPVATYPVVVANILASALDALAEVLASRVASGGRIALSGILHGQEDELLQRYAAWFDDLVATRDGDWMRIEGRRR